jgi:tetratricopeptide (TPR) repeat protein
MLVPARAELEDLAGLDQLDTDGQAALAEARWRLGDVDAAAVAAEAHLAAGGRDPIAAVIAAEAAAAEGRASDARALMDRVSGLDAPTLDALFAGMPRRVQGPSSAAAGATPDGSRAGGDAAGPTDLAAIRASGAGSVGSPIRASAVPTPAEVLAANADLWDEAALAPGVASTPATGLAMGPPTAPHPAGHAWVEPARARAHADPEAELETARDELTTAPERGLLRLALALRLDPTLAADVLDAVRLRREPAAVILRGDAQRLLGRYLEAESAFADAIESIERDAIATGHHQPTASQEDS